jgi:protein-disulfide isomerase
MLLLILNAWKHRNALHKMLWPTIFLLACAFSLSSIILAAISALIIHSHCIMCILNHVANFSLLFFSWLIHKRFNKTSLYRGILSDFYFFKKNWTGWGVSLSISVLIAAALVIWFPNYWDMDSKSLDVNLSSGITDEGYPWIGAENPEIVIHEFSDYQCFQCKKMHFFIRQLISKHQDKIRLVHRHFPMDHKYNPLVSEPFHFGSGKLAMIALYAQAIDQFWTINDFLFDLATQKENFNTAIIASKMGVASGQVVAALNNKQLRMRLKHDIATGIGYGITGTPGFMINDNLFIGQIPADILKSYVN